MLNLYILQFLLHIKKRLVVLLFCIMYNNFTVCNYYKHYTTLIYSVSVYNVMVSYVIQ